MMSFGKKLSQHKAWFQEHQENERTALKNWES